jgi:hypothetical protein
MGAMGKPLTIALALFALVAIPLGAYVGGDFWLGEAFGYFVVNKDQPYSIERDYDHLWQRDIFQPAAKVEGWVRGIEVLAIERPIIRPYTNHNVSFCKLP